MFQQNYYTFLHHWYDFIIPTFDTFILFAAGLFFKQKQHFTKTNSLPKEKQAQFISDF
jgi:hypothetical protein